MITENDAYCPSCVTVVLVEKKWNTHWVHVMTKWWWKEVGVREEEPTRNYIKLERAAEMGQRIMPNTVRECYCWHWVWTETVYISWDALVAVWHGQQSTFLVRLLHKTRGDIVTIRDIEQDITWQSVTSFPLCHVGVSDGFDADRLKSSSEHLCASFGWITVPASGRLLFMQRKIQRTHFIAW